MMVIRVLRLLRIFRILKLAQYLNEGEALLKAMRASARKIAVFLFAVLSLVLIFGSLLYLIEGDESGFTSIGVSCYWAITTLTTVGYGDISPQSPLGRAVASIIIHTRSPSNFDATAKFAQSCASASAFMRLLLPFS